MAIVLIASAVRVIGGAGGGFMGWYSRFPVFVTLGHVFQMLLVAGHITLECTETVHRKSSCRPSTKTQGRLMRSKNTLSVFASRLKATCKGGEVKA
jgi:hypothetical protein